MGLLAIVPVLGAFLIWLPAALFLLLTGHPIQALVLALWGSIVIGGIDNLLYPMLVGNRLHTHTVLVFISIVGGLFVFGAAGLVLGPVILTTTMVLLQNHGGIRKAPSLRICLSWPMPAQKCRSESTGGRLPIRSSCDRQRTSVRSGEPLTCAG